MERFDGSEREGYGAGRGSCLREGSGLRYGGG